MAKRGHRPLGYEVIHEDCNAHKRLEFVKSHRRAPVPTLPHLRFVR